MNKKELVESILAHSGRAMPKTNVELCLDGLADALRVALRAGQEVVLPGIGKFSVQHKPARTGRNPKTGEKIEVAAKNIPKFTPAKPLKDACRD